VPVAGAEHGDGVLSLDADGDGGDVMSVSGEDGVGS